MDKLRECPLCTAEVNLIELPAHVHFATGMPDHDGSWIIECDCGLGIMGSKRDALIKRWNTRPEPENKPLTLHFGEGKIGVSICRPQDQNTWNGLLLWNPHMQQAIGNRSPIAEGTTTDDVEVYARLFFHNPESAQVVVDYLNQIIDSCGRNKPLTLAELRERVNAPVFVATRKWSGWVLLCQLWDDRFNFIHPDGHISSWHKLEYLEDCEYGWLAYDRPPKEEPVER